MSTLAEAVVRHFEAARQTPGAPYDPQRFLAYLTDPPTPTGRTVRDTFRGRLRLVRFMESLQLEVGICFTNKEWERGTGLAELTSLIEAKRANRSSQARLATKRVGEARRSLVDEPIKIGLLCAAVLGPIAAATRSPIGYALVGSIWTIAVAADVALNWKGYAYAKRLAQRTGNAVEQGEGEEVR